MVVATFGVEVRVGRGWRIFINNGCRRARGGGQRGTGGRRWCCGAARRRGFRLDHGWSMGGGQGRRWQRLDHARRRTGERDVVDDARGVAEEDVDPRGLTLPLSRDRS
jgi:hypothetical protein